MNVAMVAAGEIFGGAERQIVTLSAFLRDAGATPQAFVGFDRKLASELRAQRVTTTVVPLGGRDRFSFATRIGAALARDDVHCVHLHGYQPTILLGFGRRGAWSVVKTEHGMPELHGRSFLESLKLKAYRDLESWALRRLNAHVVYVSEELRGRRSADHRRLTQSVIPNGIQTPERERTRRPVSFGLDKVNLAVVGRLEAVKGVGNAIRALAEPDLPPNLHLHVVGTGPEREGLERLAASLRVGPKVSFVGFSDRALDFIAHADALLLPSLHEGLPYVVLEAMSLGTPVLAARVGGIPEILRDGENGLLFEPGSAPAVAQAVTSIVRNPALRERLATQAKMTVASRYSLAAMGNGYLSVYRAALMA